MLIIPESEEYSNEDQSFFLSDLWCSVHGTGLKKMSIYKSAKDENPIARFTCFSYRRAGFEAIITPPKAPHCGLQFFHRTEKRISRKTDEKRALRAMAEYFRKKHPSAHLDLSLPPDILDIQPFKEADFDHDVSYTYLLELEGKTEGDLLSEMSGERRKNIKDGLKQNLEVKLNPPWKPAIDLIETTLKAQGVEAHAPVLTRLVEGGADRVFTVGVYSGDKLQSVAVIACDWQKAYYLAGGTTKTATQPGALVLWAAILESKKRGVRYFDFCGSSNPSIEKFFRGFGGELTPYFRIISVNAVFDLLQNAKRKLRK